MVYLEKGGGGMTPLPSMGWAFRPGGLGMQRDHSLNAPGVTGICDPI